MSKFQLPEKNDRQCIPRTVWVLGLVSLLMDISSEMIHALLPLFMATTLGASAVWIGFTEGMGEAAALISKVFSGAIADRFGKKKWLVFTGYALGVISKPFFALAGSMPVVFGARFFDRIGKGIRGAPRDAIIAEVTPENIRGAAYGLRQSLDAAGAFIGPALAALLLFFFTEDFRTIFWFALIPGAACLLLILLGVENVDSNDNTEQKNYQFREFFRLMTPAFKWLLAIGVLFSLARFSNAFIILKAADSGVPTALIPFVLVGVNLVFSAASFPFGKLADHLNPYKLLALGLCFLIASDTVFAIWNTPWAVALAIALFGLHLGATQGVFSFMVAQHAPEHYRATAFGAFNLLSGCSTLAAGLTAGFLWQYLGADYTFMTGALFAAGCLFLLSLLWLRRSAS